VRTQRVLIVEDDSSIGVVVCAALRSEGFEVEICETTSARNDILAQQEFDVMVTDVVLRDDDGIATLKPVIENHPGMPIIIMSAQNSLETAVRATEINAFEYFPKPFDLDELVTAIKQAAARKKNHLQDKSSDGGLEANLPMVGRSPAMQDVYRMVARLLRNDLSALILGESGTGKELVAEAIHTLGHRKTGPFIAVNMAAIPAELIEAELFGHEKGAFTGAVGQSIGRFEQAQGGTLFLDEIGDMPYQAQTRLLRTLQSGSITRVGGKANIRLDVRIVAATNQNLENLIADGKFREDLYYRLNVVPITIPALRDRAADIGLLAKHFLKTAVGEGLPERQIDDEAISALSQMKWPGNVRELQNFIFRLALKSREDLISENLVRAESVGNGQAIPQEQEHSFEQALETFFAQNLDGTEDYRNIYHRALAQFEAPLLQRVLNDADGNQLRAAKMLGINRNTLRKKLTDHGVFFARGG